MTPSELYAAGYALPLYGMYTHTFRCGHDEITLPHGVVPIIHIDGIPCAKWEDVQKAAEEMQ